MKKIFALCCAAALIFTGCSNKEKEEQLRRPRAVAEASREELADAVSDRDQLLGLVNEISSSMDRIKQLENILTVSGGTETPGRETESAPTLLLYRRLSFSVATNSKTSKRNFRNRTSTTTSCSRQSHRYAPGSTISLKRLHLCAQASAKHRTVSAASTPKSTLSTLQ